MKRGRGVAAARGGGRLPRGPGLLRRGARHIPAALPQRQHAGPGCPLRLGCSVGGGGDAEPGNRVASGVLSRTIAWGCRQNRAGTGLQHRRRRRGLGPGVTARPTAGGAAELAAAGLGAPGDTDGEPCAGQLRECVMRPFLPTTKTLIFFL